MHLFTINLNSYFEETPQSAQDAPKKLSGTASTGNSNSFDVVFAADDGGGGEIL